MRLFVVAAALLALTTACAPEEAGKRTIEGAFVPDGNMALAQIPDQFKWQLDPLFANDEAFEAGLQEVAAQRQKLKAFQGQLSSPTALRECLELYFDIRLKTNKLTMYAHLRFVSDQTDTKLQALDEKSQAALHALMADASFIRQEVIALNDSVMSSAYTTEPALATYKPYIDEQRRRRTRVLTSEAERILSLAGDNLWAEIDLNEIPSDHEKTFGGLLTDIPLPKLRNDNNELVQLTLSNYAQFRGSEDRRVRRQAVEKFFTSLKEYQHALAATLAGQIRFNIFLARSRGYERTIDAYLDKDNIDVAVYTNLIDTIRKNIKPLHDYVALRKKVMGLKEIHIYDLYTPMVPDVDMTFTYEEATKIMPEGLAPLGTRYTTALNEGMNTNNGWLDLYPSKNKESGAFSAGVYRIHPFVKMNYYQGFDDLSTLAHEYGHALHSHFSGQKQPYVTFNYSTFIAEIASTMNEKLLSDHLLKNAKNDEEKVFILNHLANSIRTTIYRQTLFADFELRVHTEAEKGTPITAELLNKTYKDLIAEYYGPEFTIDENDDIEWAYIPHFYYKFYMYTYATGLSSGIALAERVQSGDPAKRDAYLGLLEAGSSKPPLDILKDAGVDLTRPEAIEAGTRLMATTIKQMEAILAPRLEKPEGA
ncbi:oligoendopeptidase F [Myxococcota bacterium]